MVHHHHGHAKHHRASGADRVHSGEEDRSNTVGTQTPGRLFSEPDAEDVVAFWADAHEKPEIYLPLDATGEPDFVGDLNSSHGKRTAILPLSVTTVVVTETVVTVIDTSPAGEPSLSRSRSLMSIESIAASLTGTVTLNTMAALTVANTSPLIATPASPSLAVDTPAPTSVVGNSSPLDASRTLAPSSLLGSVQPIVSTSHNFNSSAVLSSQHSSGTSTPVMSPILNATTTQDGSSDSLASPPQTTDGWNGAGAMTGIGQPTQTGQAQTPGPAEGSTAKIVGGVVGGVAGVLLLVFAALLLVSRHKRFAFAQRTRGDSPAAQIDRGPLHESDSHSAEMSYRRASHDPLFVAATLAPAFVKRWRRSNRTSTTDSTTGSMTGERGFQKISGRKIPSVFRSGGDGYGGGVEDEFDASSPPRTGFSLSPAGQSRMPAASPPPPSSAFGAPLDLSYTREDAESAGAVVVRPSPARTPVRTPVTSSVTVTPHQVTPRQARTHSPAMPKRPDALGRSHPSFDGSRGSRFTESLDI